MKAMKMSACCEWMSMSKFFWVMSCFLSAAQALKTQHRMMLHWQRKKNTHACLTLVTLVSSVSRAALAAKRAPVGKAGGVNAAGGTGCRHTHPVCQPAPWGTVHAFTWRLQVIHLREVRKADYLVVKTFSKISFCVFICIWYHYCKSWSSQPI